MHDVNLGLNTSHFFKTERMLYTEGSMEHSMGQSRATVYGVLSIHSTLCKNTLGNALQTTLLNDRV